MSDSADDLRSRTEASFADDELLGVFAKRFRPFHRGRDLGDSYASLAKRLDGKRLTGVMQLSIREGRRISRRCVVMSPTGSEVADADVEDPDLEVITDAETWDAISRGKLSAMEAFGNGRLRVRGDIRLAHRIAAKLR